jgi:hypothetical protein
METGALVSLYGQVGVKLTKISARMHQVYHIQAFTSKI